LKSSLELAAGTGSSVVVTHCQVCDHAVLERVLFLGYLPPVNQMRTQGSTPQEQPAYPALLLRCKRCQLVQLGLVVDPTILFPPEYPYSSGTTRILRDNFAELYGDSQNVVKLKPADLVVDVGSNDGTLLSNFKNTGHRVFGVEPSDMGKLAISRGIPSLIAFFGPAAAAEVVEQHGRATIVTATNVFAHIENVHEIVDSIIAVLDDNGVFISESHYLLSLIETLQYDTVYHEHLRYYSLHSLQYLLNMHGLEVVRVKRIPTHGGSIRVYSARKGEYPVDVSVKQALDAEVAFGLLESEVFTKFKHRVTQSKLDIMALLRSLKNQGKRVVGIGAPSRASTLISYMAIDDGILDAVLEVPGSYKIGKYMPGTLIPVVDEGMLFRDQPDYAMLLSWHIADELMPKLKAKGFTGKFIIPLPEARIVD
jgi:C-methyltransferase C-terminal domain/Methyltransferase domain/Putative zinc binding domain